MSRLLPFKSEPTQKPDGARVLSLEDEATDEALSALSSQTAREVLSLIYEEPRTPPEIRDEIDSSLQNVHYHLENLEEAGLIRPAGSGYSEKGTEMNVYAPANEAVVLFAGQRQDRSRLKTALSRLVGGIGALALGTYVIDRLGRTGTVGPQSVSTDGAGGGDSGAPPPETTAEGAQVGGDGGGVDTTTTGATDTASDGGIGIMDAGTDTATGTPDPAGTSTPTPGAIETPTPTPTAAPSPTPQGTPTATPPPQGTPTATPQPTPTSTPAPTPSPTPQATPSPTPAPTQSPTPTEQPVGVAEGTDTVVAEGTAVATETPLPTVSASGGDGGLFADPAVTFFLGGVFMLVVLTAWWYYQG